MGVSWVGGIAFEGRTLSSVGMSGEMSGGGEGEEEKAGEGGKAVGHGKRISGSRMVLQRLLSLLPGMDYFQTWEIGLISGCIPGEECEISHSGVRADIKIGQWCGSCAATASVREVALPGEETRFPRKGLTVIDLGRKRGIKRLDCRKANGNLRVDYRIDEQLGVLPATGDRLRRPC